MKVYLGEKNSCSLNYQSEYINYELEKHFEITKEISEADLIVVSETCCCTEHAISFLMEYLKYIVENKKPNAKIFLTGCITREFKSDPKLDIIKPWLKEYVDYIIPHNLPNALLNEILPMQYTDNEINTFGGCSITDDKSANIYIANGCYNNCAFCKNTYLKYPLKSMNFSELKESIDFINEQNIDNLRILATNLCQYGLDTEKKHLFPDLIEYIENKENIKKVSLIGFAFKDAIKNNFAPILKESQKVTCVNGSLESGSDRLLKLMRKGFTSAEIIDFVKEVREKYYKQIYLNIIAGFPTENMDDIKRTLEVLKDLQPSDIDLCKYRNSSFVDSNQYEQLSKEQIDINTRIYSRVLKRRGITFDII